MQEIINKYLDANYTLGVKEIRSNTERHTPLLLYYVVKELMVVFGLSADEVKAYLIVWAMKQNKLFNFLDYWGREEMDSIKISLIL